jgi:hypothetical protein
MSQIEMKKGESYVYKWCWHLKNVPIFASTKRSTILEQCQNFSKKCGWKCQQFVITLANY